MHLLYLIGILFLSIGLFRFGANPATIYLFPWLVIFLNYYLGPIEYLINTDNLLSTIFLFVYLSIFLAGFWLSNILFTKSKARNRLYGKNVDAPKWLLQFEKVGILGVTLYFFGRLITGANFILAGNLSGLRASFIDDTNLFSQIGAILIGLYFFVISKSLFYKESYRVSYIPLAMFILTPLLTAGRQLYLILMLMIFMSFLLLRTKRYGIFKQLIHNKIIVYPIIGGSFFLILAISVLRFDIDSQLYFGDKLSMLRNFSAIELREEYTFLTSLPTTYYDTIIEFFYYFGAQLARYYELFGVLSFDLFNFDILSKTPVIQRNIEKILIVFDLQSVPLKFEYPELSIASFTWSTALIGGLRYGGIVTVLSLQFIFGLIMGLAYRRFKFNRNDYPAFNLMVISSVICIYDVMFPLISDTSVMVYYLFSVLIFFLKSKHSPQLLVY